MVYLASLQNILSSSVFVLDITVVMQKTSIMVSRCWQKIHH